MAVQSMRQLPGRSGDYGRVLEHTREIEFIAQSDSRYETDYDICNYGWSRGILPIPYVTAIEGVVPLVRLLCRKLSIRQDKKAPLVYYVTAHYSSEPISQSERDRQANPNPLDKPAAFVWRTNRYSKAVSKDVDGNAIVNSAGEYFDPPPEIELFRWTVTVTKNVAAVPTFILEWAEGGPVNEQRFVIQGIPVDFRTARVVDMNIGDLQTAQVGEETIEYYVWSYSLEFRKDGWAINLLDQGVRELDPDDETKRIAIMDDSVPPREVKRAWPLDGEGHRLDDPKPENAVQLEFNVITPQDFTVLPGIEIAGIEN